MPVNTKIAVFLIALASLMSELLMIRVLDVILSTQLEYMIITCAMFSLGAAGIWKTLYVKNPAQEMRLAAYTAIGCAILLVCIRPLFNTMSFDYSETTVLTLGPFLMFVAIYLLIFAVFFCVGFIFIIIMSLYSKHIRTFYCWDLVGAACGCIIILPFLQPIGPGGLLYWAAALIFIAAALLLHQRKWYAALGLAAAICFYMPIKHYPAYYDFDVHNAKRGVLENERQHNIELTRWDPVAKIDIIPISNSGNDKIVYKHIAYEGGTRSSRLYPFDGNYQGLRQELESGKEKVSAHFSGWGVLPSHFLKRDQGQRVLVIGSAGGQETKAALMYGASHVDAIDVVGAVIDITKNEDGAYVGQVYSDPRVNAIAGEGRSFLRASKEKYDIIQIYSPSTSSSIAWGYGALRPVYLHTVEAYEEYFRHLTDNGILHVNYHTYPRLICVAAAAWGRLGRDDFQKHVVVLRRPDQNDSLPTVLIKMQPWTKTEIKEINDLLKMGGGDIHMIENPSRPRDSIVGKTFFWAELQEKISHDIPYKVGAITDDRPYYTFQQYYFNYLPEIRSSFLNTTTAQSLGDELKMGRFPMETGHVFSTAIITVLCIGLFVIAPLYFSSAGKSLYVRKSSMLTYFACLGAGFMILELSLIHVFLKLVGYPLYTYSIVIFSLLFSAGLGSAVSTRLSITPVSRWTWPFIGIVVSGVLMMLLLPALSTHFLQDPLLVRVAITGLMLFPLGFFLGMPFPLGITAISYMAPEAVAWAWALNSTFTAVGGLVTFLFSVLLGFKITVFIGLSIYVLALGMFALMRIPARN